jgi:hypothetical protein
VLGDDHLNTPTSMNNLTLTRRPPAIWTGQAGNAAAVRDRYAALLSLMKQVLVPSTPTCWPPG